MINTMLRKHSITNVRVYSLMTILVLLCIDNSAIPFVSRHNTALGIKLCIDTFKKFELIIHTGIKEKDSKIIAVFFQ